MDDLSDADLTGIRRFELQALRWRDLNLLDGVLRVGASKSEEGERSVALSRTLDDELSAHYRRTAFKGDDELVFCHPTRGTKIDPLWYAREFRAALKTAGITDYGRPFHDARHASLTNGAAAGESPIALMTREVTARWTRPRSTCTWPGPSSPTRRLRSRIACSAVQPCTDVSRSQAT